MSTVKNIKSFWWLKPYIAEKGYNVGHSLFSLGHILWIIGIIIIAIIVAKYYKKSNEPKRQNIRRICALIIFLLEYFKLVIVALAYPSYIDEYIPLHLCSVAGMCIIFDALWPNKKVVNTWWMYVFLPCGLLAILTPSSTYPWFNFFCIHEFVFHGMLIIYSLCKILSGESKLSYKGLWYSALLPITMMIPIYYINVTFNKGYMLITDPSDFPLTQFLWKMTVPKFGVFGYIGTLIIIGVIIFHLIYLILKITEIIKNKMQTK